MFTDLLAVLACYCLLSLVFFLILTRAKADLETVPQGPLRFTVVFMLAPVVFSFSLGNHLTKVDGWEKYSFKAVIGNIKEYLSKKETL